MSLCDRTAILYYILLKVSITLTAQMHNAQRFLSQSRSSKEQWCGGEVRKMEKTASNSYSALTPYPLSLREVGQWRRRGKRGRKGVRISVTLIHILRK